MRYFNKKDFIIVGLALLISIIMIVIYLNFFDKSEKVAEIYYDSELVMTISLDKKEDKFITLPQNENVIFHLLEDGGIGFYQSDCQDKICINSGILNHSGSSAACLPNKTILKIVPTANFEDGDIDIAI